MSDSEKTNCYSVHERSVSLFLVDLVADVVDVGWKVVLGMVVDYVTDIGEDQVFEYAVLEVFQKPVESVDKNVKFRKTLVTFPSSSHLSWPSFQAPSDLVVVQLINQSRVSLVFDLLPSFPLPFLTSRWPPGSSRCLRRVFSCPWWSSFLPGHGSPGSVRS